MVGRFGIHFFAPCFLCSWHFFPPVMWSALVCRQKYLVQIIPEKTLNCLKTYCGDSLNHPSSCRCCEWIGANVTFKDTYQRKNRLDWLGLKNFL